MNKGFTPTPVSTWQSVVSLYKTVISKRLKIKNNTRSGGFAKTTTLKQVSGFTLIEIVVALALLAIITGIVFFSFSNLNNTNAIETNVAGVVSYLAEARSNTLSSKNDSQYGVHIAFDKVVMFVGGLYTEGSASNTTFPLHSKVEIVDIALTGGGDDIVFDRLNGGTSQNGSFVIRLKNDTTASTTVIIFGTGIIETD